MPQELGPVAPQNTSYIPPTPTATRELWLPFDMNGAMSPDIQPTEYLPRGIARPLQPHEVARSEMDDRGALIDAAEQAARVAQATRHYEAHLLQRWQGHNARGQRNANGFNPAAHAVEMPFTGEQQRALHRMLAESAPSTQATVPHDLGTAALQLSTESLKTEVVPTSQHANGAAHILRAIGLRSSSSAGRHRVS